MEGFTMSMTFAELRAADRMSRGLPAEKANYWQSVRDALAAVSTATSAAGVVEALNANMPDPDDRTIQTADAFFYGTGGDDSLIDALKGDWRIRWVEGGYHYKAISPEGDHFAYIEGDLYLNRDN